MKIKHISWSNCLFISSREHIRQKDQSVLQISTRMDATVINFKTVVKLKLTWSQRQWKCKKSLDSGVGQGLKRTQKYQVHPSSDWAKGLKWWIELKWPTPQASTVWCFWCIERTEARNRTYLHLIIFYHITYVCNSTLPKQFIRLFWPGSKGAYRIAIHLQAMDLNLRFPR